MPRGAVLQGLRVNDNVAKIDCWEDYGRVWREHTGRGGDVHCCCLR